MTVSHTLDAKRMARDEPKSLIYLSSGIILNQAWHLADSDFLCIIKWRSSFGFCTVFYVNAPTFQGNILPPYLDRIGSSGCWIDTDEEMYQSPAQFIGVWPITASKEGRRLGWSRASWIKDFRGRWFFSGITGGMCGNNVAGCCSVFCACV